MHKAKPDWILRVFVILNTILLATLVAGLLYISGQVSDALDTIKEFESLKDLADLPFNFDMEKN